MVKIRLMRMGKKGAPTYRVVVADVRSPRDGRIIETIGWYNPRTEPSTIQIDPAKAVHWLGVGAQPTESTRSLLTRAGILDKHGRPAAAASSTTPAATATVDAEPPAKRPTRTRQTTKA
jgi:small subunit ribosomal protein S16